MGEEPFQVISKKSITARAGTTTATTKLPICPWQKDNRAQALATAPYPCLSELQDGCRSRSLSPAPTAHVPPSPAACTQPAFCRTPQRTLIVNRTRAQAKKQTRLPPGAESPSALSRQGPVLSASRLAALDNHARFSLLGTIPVNPRHEKQIDTRSG